MEDTQRRYPAGIVAVGAAVLVCVVTAVALIALSAWSAGRPLAQSGHVAVDIGATVGVALVTAIAASYLPLLWLRRRLGRLSLMQVIVVGVLIGIGGFVGRFVMFAEGEDQASIVAYVRGLSHSPAELAGLAPFILGGVAFVLLLNYSRNGRVSTRSSPR